MGLREYRKFKREEELKESETISFLMNKINELEKEVAELKEQKTIYVQPTGLTEDEKKKMKAIQDQKTKPEDFISMFTEDLQEFTPNV